MDLALKAKTEFGNQYRNKLIKEAQAKELELMENQYSLEIHKKVLEETILEQTDKVLALESELSRLNTSAVSLKSLYQVTQYRVGRNTLYAMLRDAGLLNRNNEPTSLSVKSNYLTRVGNEVFVTVDGLNFVYELLKDKEKQIINYPKVEDIKNMLDLAIEELEFDEPTHVYKLGNRTVNSVSSVLKNYVPEFPAVIVAKAIGRRDNRDYKEILAEWEHKRDFASNYGNMVHYGIENEIALKYLPEKEVKDLTINEEIFGDKLEEIKEKAKDRVAKLLAYVDSLVADGHQIIDTEVKMVDKVLGVAGTLDLLTLKDNKLYIIDWKSNDKDITSDSYNNYLKAPFNTLPSTTLNKYAIQLSLYQKLLSRVVPIEVADRIVVHIREEVVTYSTKDYSELV
jgi:hypothetical protein